MKMFASGRTRRPFSSTPQTLPLQRPMLLSLRPVLPLLMLSLASCVVGFTPRQRSIYCPSDVHVGEVFSQDGCNDCMCTKSGAACTTYACPQCLPGSVFYRDMCKRCVCGQKGTFACNMAPCSIEIYD